MNNKNNASQTLFRFVSLRNPQLTETKEDNLGFIHRPETISGTFDAAISSVMTGTALQKIRYMESATEAFSLQSFKSEKQIQESGYSELFSIGKKIAKQEILDDAEINLATQKFNNLDNTSLTNLWDNLIYQVVTQKDFYVKEAVVNVLKALHLGKVNQMTPTDELKKLNGDDLNAKSLDARVVLPIVLFGDGSNSSSNINFSNSFTVGKSAISDDIIYTTDLPNAVQEKLKWEGEKITEISTLSQEKGNLEQLKLELEKIQKSYYKIKNKRYDKAYQDYLAKYQEEINDYNRRLEEVEAQIKEDTPEEEIRALYADLGEMNVPPFDFTYKAELNFEDFTGKLSLESLYSFVSIFTEPLDGQKPDTGYDYSNMSVLSDRQLKLGEATVAISEEYDTYLEVFEKLNEEISLKTQSLFAKSPLQEQIYANLGGVLIPINNSTSENTTQTINRSYYLQANYHPEYSRAPGYVTFYYQAENNSWGLSSAKIVAVTEDGNYEENFSNISISNNKVMLPPFLMDNFKTAIRSLKIQIYFNNGEEATLDLSNITINQPYTGILYTERIKGETENPTTGTSDPKPGNFMPKHFGIKRLGIADYLKVVQSTHAYVPGEVTHIENVMAKEFKQKSTRRLRKSEIQTTTSKSTEREALSDTTSTSRNDLQTEVANVIQQNTAAEAHFRYGGESFEVGGSFASNNSKENSTRQAISKSQEITEKATERILTKVSEERIEKIIEEFEENNAHGFDNRNGEEHVVGVYRWVDKKMKNQIFNYGKRNMFEFMIPEPAKLHRLATFASKETINQPIDPRKAPEPHGMKDASASDDFKLKYWADYYNITLDDTIKKDLIVSHKVVGSPQSEGNGQFSDTDFIIPDDYTGKNASILWSTTRQRKRSGVFQGNYIMASAIRFSNLVGGDYYFSDRNDGMGGTQTIGALNLNGTNQFKVSGGNISQFSFNINVKCSLSDSYLSKWRKEQFDRIIEAYEAAYANFLEKQKEAEEKAKEEVEKNAQKLGNFYRDMERVTIKHNCIAYLLQDYLNLKTLGQNLTNNAETMDKFSVLLGEDLDQYTALAKFLEQAFEWTIMDYTFYPYYWANRKEWQKMYLSESTDPLFRSFLQAGMARVVVTVNPGFEDAVQFFMCTGKIWNDGEVPVIGDPLYMSIVDEMREPLGVKQGKAWITTLPTSLTILQDDAAGLKTDTALPFTQENPDDFEVPGDVVIETDFKLTGAQLNSGDDKFVDNIELNNGFLQLTTDDNPKEIVAQIPLADLKQALQ